LGIKFKLIAKNQSNFICGSFKLLDFESDGLNFAKIDSIGLSSKKILNPEDVFYLSQLATTAAPGGGLKWKQSAK